ncbi:NADH-quinone oxidoreductase subunit C [bacterium]|nr:MAG: NADH-quinone oxidoreductase subunit C [bacterium]
MNTALSTLKNKFPGISEEAATGCQIVPAQDIKEACLFLKESLGFAHLMCLTSIDYKDNLALVYNLYSYKAKEKAALKVFLDRNNPAVDSVAEIWRGADWHEREAFDMMGINFLGHPDLRRILLPDDWTGHPLRKDYAREGLEPMPHI